MDPSSMLQVSHQQQVNRKLATARFHIRSLETLSDWQDDECHIAAEAATSAAITELLQVLDATLYGFSVLLPDPLPPSRMSRRNLRDRFYSIQGQSQVLRLVDQANRPDEGWLWWLERKADGGRFFPLLHQDVQAGAPPSLWKDPANRAAGVESDPPPIYLQTSLDRMQELIDRVMELIPEDLFQYRECWRVQWCHLI